MAAGAGPGAAPLTRGRDGSGAEGGEGSGSPRDDGDRGVCNNNAEDRGRGHRMAKRCTTVRCSFVLICVRERAGGSRRGTHGVRTHAHTNTHTQTHTHTHNTYTYTWRATRRTHCKRHRLRLTLPAVVTRFLCCLPHRHPGRGCALLSVPRDSTASDFVNQVRACLQKLSEGPA